jgi:hypothetical protein
MGGETVNLPDKKDKQIVSAVLAWIIWWRGAGGWDECNTWCLM